jgi:hypothetical protein
MVHPSFITMLIGAAVMAALLGIDWYVWGLTYRSDFRRKPAVAAEPEPSEQGFRRVA